jgi:hypothetical protein
MRAADVFWSTLVRAHRLLVAGIIRERARVF